MSSSWLLFCVMELMVYNVLVDYCVEINCTVLCDDFGHFASHVRTFEGLAVSSWLYLCFLSLFPSTWKCVEFEGVIVARSIEYRLGLLRCWHSMLIN